MDIKNKTAKSKACFNMAVTCELAGEMTLAKEWLDKSQKLGMPEYYIQEYAKQLKERTDKMQILDQQMKQEAVPDE
jgi:hypothetical protein